MVTLSVRFLIGLSVLLVVVTNVTAQDDPCLKHKLILNAEKRNPFYEPVNPDSTVRFCDLTLEPGWYRAASLHGDDMPTTAPELGACNTGFPIWLNGNLPAQADGTVDRTACKVSVSDNCSQTFAIKIKNCGMFRVYRLVPTASCPVAYCFGVKAPCPAGKSSEDGFLPGCSHDFPKVTVTPTVVADVLKSPTDTTEQVIFVCRIAETLNAAYKVDILWIINGADVKLHKGLTLGEEKTLGVLQEKDWRDTFRLGMMVQCAVRVRYDMNRIPGPRMTSVEFFAGVQVITPVVDVTEGQTVKLRFKSTIPITCPTNIHTFLCGVRFLVSTVKQEDISELCKGADGTKVYLKNCGFDLPAGNQKEVYMTVNTKTDNFYIDKITQVSLTATPRNQEVFKDDIWTDVVLPKILVNVHDKDFALSGKRCHSINDPHMRTFDGRYYELHLPGEFVLYRHKVLPIQVHTFHKPCSVGSTIYCVCGAAVQSSRDVFVVDYCKGIQASSRSARIQKYGCSNNQMSISRRGNNFQVLLTTGTMVSISTYGYSYPFINIHVAPAVADLGQTEGLCGFANNDTCDDFVGPDGKQFFPICRDTSPSLRPDNFSESWRIDSDQFSLFGGKPVNAWAVQTIPGQCSCQERAGQLEISTDVFCDSPPIQCTNADADVTKLFSQSCSQLAGRRRRRRDTQELDLDYDDDDTEYVFTYEKVDSSKIPDWSGDWNETKARNFCIDYFENTAIYQACKAVPNLDSQFSVDGCILDIQYTGNTDWALNTLEVYKSTCNNEAWRNVTLHKRNPATPNKPSVFEMVTEVSCLNECADHGQCVNGSCQCESEWMGEDCSTSVYQPVQLFGTPKNGTCDLSVKSCTATIVYGQNFANTPSLKCRVRTITKSTAQSDHSGVTTEAIYRFAEEIVCRLPYQTSPEPTKKTPQNRHGDGLAKIDVTGFMISVTNKDSYSNEILFLPYDKTCISCTTSGGAPTCLLKRDYCYIEDMCFEQYEANPDNGAQKCDVHESNRHWSSGDCGDPATGSVFSKTISLATLSIMVVVSLLVKKMA